MQPGYGPGYGQPAGYSSSSRGPNFGPHGPYGPHGPPPQGFPPFSQEENPQSQSPVNNQVQPQQQVINVVNAEFGTLPVSITCQFCKTPVTTNVKKSCSCCSCLLCIVTVFFIWLCIQCFRKKEINCCDAQHTCPNCGQILGNYKSC
jgi:lipopolysaccharide-induced tumor necrosis factor-alpha factor